MKEHLPTILITGGNGQLAQALRAAVQPQQYNLIALSRNELNITDESKVNTALNHYKPQFVINTAAYTAVDQAESLREVALAANYLGAKHLAKACETRDAALIHLSTDYIFNADTKQSENDTPNPLNYYGHTKLLGEEAIRKYAKRHYILRVSGIFSEYGHNFMKTILKLAQQRESLNIVHDQINCPTDANDIASAIYKIIAINNEQYGTYHYCSKDPTSWYDFANAILNAAKTLQEIKIVTKHIHPIASAQYATAAARPAYSALDCSKIADTFEIAQPHWQNAITSVLAKLI